MSFNTIIFEVSAGVATLTLNRPDRLNSFNTEMHEEVQEAFKRIDADHSVRCILLTGAGRGFCAGQDLSDRAVAPGAESVDLGASVDKYYNPLIRKITSIPMPVVCAVNGVAAGAGANIAIACDIVLAAKSAKFIESFANIGLIPDSGGTYHLPRLLGQTRALGMALTGDPVSAQQAEEWGLIWKSVDDAELMNEANKLASNFANGPTQGLAQIKALIRSSWTRDIVAQTDLERDTMRVLGRTDDYKEAVDAFLNKRKPVFKNR